MKEKKLGLPSVVATGVGLIVATSCLLSTGQGASAVGLPFIITIIIACGLNMLLAMSISELNALMPNLTGGLAQYSLACIGPFLTQIAMVGGYLVCLTIVSSAECAMFGNTIVSIFPGLPVSGTVLTIVLLIVLILTNLQGIDMFAKIQDFVAYTLIASLIIMGIIGVFGWGTGSEVSQPMVLSTSFSDITSLCGLAFFLFIGVEFIVPIAPQVKNARHNIPKGMIISLMIILVMQILLTVGFTIWVVFPAMGRDYEAAVISAGFGGITLGSTATAIANMTAVAQQHGAAHRAFVIVPLVCGFFIDIVNALIISALVG